MGKAGSILAIISLFFSFFFFLSEPAYAARTPRCTDADPGSAPSITGVTTQGTTVTLTWSPALEPVTHYTIAYGPAKDQLIYGAPNIGPQGTGSFVVDQLTTGQRYYFRIRAVNNCEPGEFSDTVSVVVGVNKDARKLEIPRLSFFKVEKTASPSVAIAHTEKTQKNMVVLAAKGGQCVNSCMSIPLLGSQVVVLLLYFFLAHKTKFFKPIFSVLIPFAFYGIFLLVNRNCNSYFFFCEYFGILSLISYMLILLLQKQLLFQKLLDPHLVAGRKESKNA